ncbi:hypothetical protein ACHMW6_33855 [Pseudoduganella sp. UC29_106]|uniref:hypothetical protein n=1 Tax=Pseudoduganella sp. UC29_106 TaxID=3374553 RepID=UPI0037571D41
MINNIESWLNRRTAFLTNPRAETLAMWLVPLLLGLLSVALGQDEGWDMRNYHLYNAYAVLEGRVGFDFAPGGFQSYFNPTLELPYFLLTSWLAPQLVAFIFGVVQGINFPLVLAIIRCVVGKQAGPRLPLLLALAGILSIGFLAELGNSMGDNLTAILTLWSLLLLLQRWEQLSESKGLLYSVLSGVLMGLGAGLKLTNAVYAVGLCLSIFLLAPGNWMVRLRLAFVFGLGVLAGIAMAGGWWMLEMWKLYGNPLFPQFNNIFHSPLAAQKGIMDLYHLPNGWTEVLLWPFVFTKNFVRVSELDMRQSIWAVSYVLFIALGVRWLLRRRSEGVTSRHGSFVLLFFAISYLVWMKVFSIHRYLIPAEMLAPLVVWILLQRLLPPAAAQRAAIVVLGAVTLYALPFSTWGHADWADRSFSADVPEFSQPASSIVYLTEPDPPFGWLVQLFPRDVQFIGLGIGFPESPLYHEKIAEAGRARSGPHYVLFNAAHNPKDQSLRKKIEAFQFLGMTKSEESCARLDRLLTKVRFQVQVRKLSAGGAERCTLELQPKYQLDLEAMQRDNEQKMTEKVAQWGLKLDQASCRTYKAAIGIAPHPYRLCRVDGP